MPSKTDRPKSRHPWFQLHLSTCVAMMVVAGSLVGAILAYPSKDAVAYSTGYPMAAPENHTIWYIERSYDYGYWSPFFVGFLRTSIKVEPRYRDPPPLDGVLGDPAFTPGVREWLTSSPSVFASEPFDGKWRTSGLFANGILIFAIVASRTLGSGRFAQGGWPLDFDEDLPAFTRRFQLRQFHRPVPRWRRDALDGLSVHCEI